MNGGDPWVRTKDGIATPFQLGKKSAQCTLSVMHFVFRFRMLFSFLFYFILFYLRYLRGECVSYFRIWHVSCELPTMGSYSFMSSLPLWRCCNFGCPFFM